MNDAVPNHQTIELTILMPCLNEAETLAICINKAFDYLARSGLAGEVVIADNGSTDGSQEIARTLGARVVDISARGYGAALQGGIQSARGTYIIMGDSDDSYDFSSLDPFIAKLRDGYDLVMGNRFAGGIRPGAMPKLHRYLGNPVLTAIGRIFFRSPCRDFHCGLRGFRRDSALALGLQCDGMEFASEMVVKAAMHRLDPNEIGLADEPVMPISAEIDRWTRAFTTVPADLQHNYVEVGEALAASIPPAVRPVVNHGDYRLGNTLCEGGRLTAIIDWEIWSVGDPRIDLTWMTFFCDDAKHPSQMNPAPSGMPEGAELLAAYVEAGGEDYPDMDWFNALTYYKEAGASALLLKRALKQPEGIFASMIASMIPGLPLLLDKAMEILSASGGSVALRG